MSGRPDPALALFLFLVPFAPGLSAQATPPELLPVPHPALERMEEGVRERLRAERGVLDRYLGQESPDPETLGLAFAAMGQLYQVYDLSRPAVACFENARRLRPMDYRWPYHLGVLHQLGGELELARDRLLEAGSLAPRDAPTQIRLGQALMDLNDLDGAEQAFREVLAADSGSAAGHYGLGRVHYARGQLAEAIQHLETALELQPEADSIHYLLGMAYRRTGDLEQARAHLALNRHTPVSFPDPLLDALAPLAQSAERHFNAGIEALRREDHQTAVRHLRDSLEIDPENALSHYNLGLALAALGRHEKAETALRRALELDPDYSSTHYHLGALLAEDGRREEASRHFAIAHELDPRDPEAHLQWATSLAARGDIQRAVEELETLVERHPRHAAAHRLLGRVADGQGASAQALEHYRQAAEIDPDSAENQSAWGAALGRAGRFVEAAAAYERAIRLVPDDPDVHFGRAMALVLGGRYSQARAALEEGLEAVPDNVPLTHLLARLLAACPDPGVRDGARAFDLATTVFERQRSWDHAETLAMALAELGRFDEAVELQRRVVAEADAGGDGAAAERARSRLTRYERRQPVRAPWQRAEE